MYFNFKYYPIHRVKIRFKGMVYNILFIVYDSYFYFTIPSNIFQNVKKIQLVVMITLLP